MGHKKLRISAKYTLIALVILFVAVAVIIGLWRVSDDTPTPIENPSDVYNVAAFALNEAGSVCYEITGTKSFSVNGNLITESFIKYVTAQGLNNSDPYICVEEALSIADYDILLFDIYDNGTEYTTVQGVSFCAPVTTDEYMAKQIPVVPISSSLYSEIVGEHTAKQSRITFSGASEAEAWVSGSAATLVSASGTVCLDASGSITTSEYVCEYICGNTAFQLQVTVEILPGEAADTVTPDPSVYKEVVSIDTPLQLEKACGYLLAVGNISADYTDSVTCQAFGDERKQTVHVEIHAADNWRGQIDTVVSASNTGKAGVITTTSKTEVFRDNVYTVATNGDTPAVNEEIDLETMKAHCENQLIGTIVLPQYIADITHTDTDDACYIAFRATEEFAQVLMNEVCNTLYQSPAVLDNMSDSYETNTVTAYITLDRITGFPLSSGFNYLGTYTMSGLPYYLSFQADQTYSVTNAVQ